MDSTVEPVEKRREEEDNIGLNLREGSEHGPIFILISTDVAVATPHTTSEIGVTTGAEGGGAWMADCCIYVTNSNNV